VFLYISYFRLISDALHLSFKAFPTTHSVYRMKKGSGFVRLAFSFYHTIINAVDVCAFVRALPLNVEDRAQGSPEKSEGLRAPVYIQYSVTIDCLHCFRRRQQRLFWQVFHMVSSMTPFRSSRSTRLLKLLSPQCLLPVLSPVLLQRCFVLLELRWDLSK